MSCRKGELSTTSVDSVLQRRYRPHQARHPTPATRSEIPMLKSLQERGMDFID